MGGNMPAEPLHAATLRGWVAGNLLSLPTLLPILIPAHYSTGDTLYHFYHRMSSFIIVFIITLPHRET